MKLHAYLLSRQASARRKLLALVPRDALEKHLGEAERPWTMSSTHIVERCVGGNWDPDLVRVEFEKLLTRANIGARQ